MVNTAAESPGVGPAIVLRPWSETDAAALREAIDEDVDHLRPWLSWTLEEPATLERTRERLRSYVEQFENRSALRFAIVPAGNPVRILGGAGLATRFGPGAYDVGYWVRRSSTGQGVARAAVAALIIHAFGERDVVRLVIQCDTANDRSASLGRSLRFRFAGEAVTAYPNGAPRPVLRFEMTRDEFDNEHADLFRDLARRVRILTRPDGSK